MPATKRAKQRSFQDYSATFYKCTVSVMDGFQFSPASCSVLKSQSQFPIELLFIVELMVLFVSLHTEST